VDRVAFDVSLPEAIAGAQAVYWSTRIPGEQGSGVVLMDAIRLVMTMATTMSMRSKKVVFFEVTGDEDPDGPTRADFAQLRRIVRGLSRPPQDVVA